MKKTINVLLLVVCFLFLSGFTEGQGWSKEDYFKAKNGNGDAKLKELLEKTNDDNTTGISCEYNFEGSDIHLSGSSFISNCDRPDSTLEDVCEPAIKLKSFTIKANMNSASLHYVLDSGTTGQITMSKDKNVFITIDGKRIEYDFQSMINDKSSNGCFDNLKGEVDGSGAEAKIVILQLPSFVYYSYTGPIDDQPGGGHPGSGQQTSSFKQYSFGVKHLDEMRNSICCDNIYLELGRTSDGRYYASAASKSDFSDRHIGYSEVGSSIPLIVDNTLFFERLSMGFTIHPEFMPRLFPDDGEYPETIRLCEDKPNNTYYILPGDVLCSETYGLSADVISGTGLCEKEECTEIISSSQNPGGSTDQTQDIVPIELCEKSGVLQSFKIIGYILFVAKIAIPLILIVMATLDLAKAVISGDEKANSKAFSALVRRIVLGVIIFFIPTVINFVFSLVDGATDVTDKYTPCTKCLFEPGECNSGYLEQITDDKYVGNDDSSTSTSPPSSITPITPQTSSTTTSQREYIWPVGSATALPDGTFAGTPVSTRITSYFGNREQPVAGATTDHGAIDIGVAVGTPVIAVKDGKVVAYANNCSPGDYSTCDGGSYGNYLKISHDNSISTLYAHLKYAKVGLNEQVKQGQLIGYSGNTGRTTGPHLHFEVRNGNTKVDPLKYVSTTNPR